MECKSPQYNYAPSVIITETLIIHSYDISVMSPGSPLRPCGYYHEKPKINRLLPTHTSIVLLRFGLDIHSQTKV